MQQPACPEERLWRAVLLQILQDLKTIRNNPSEIAAKHDARRWLELCTADFDMVCTMAGLEPQWVRERLAKGQELLLWRAGDVERREAVIRTRRERMAPNQMELF